MSDKQMNEDLREELRDVNERCTQAICCDVSRVYDSCADKDCIEDLRVYFPNIAQSIIDNASSIRCRNCEIINCYVDVEPTPFSRGFYSVDATFFFRNTFDVFTTPNNPPVTVCGLSTYSKKCILYGSEGSVRIFSSDYQCDRFDEQTISTATSPKAKVQAVDPICLSATLSEVDHCCDCCPVPGSIARLFEGEFQNVEAQKIVTVTIGMFIIIQLQRDVQMLIPAYDFCIPQKECSIDDDTPCDVFKKIQFPVDEFFPPESDNISDSNAGSGCGCKR